MISTIVSDSGFPNFQGGNRVQRYKRLRWQSRKQTLGIVGDDAHPGVRRRRRARGDRAMSLLRKPTLKVHLPSTANDIGQFNDTFFYRALVGGTGIAFS